MIVSHSMLMMDLTIIQRWLWRLFPRLGSRKQLMILLEQSVDDRGHLPGKATNHFFTANESMRPFVSSTLAGKQTLVDFFPLGIPLNSSPDNQIHGPFHLPNTPRSEASPVERPPR